MIRTALEFVKKELDAYVVLREQDPQYPLGGVVELKPLVKMDGTSNINDSAHVNVMLVGVDEERREGKRPHYIPTDDKQFFRLNPPVELDLLVLFAAQNGDYQTALRDLSSVVGFFQSNPVFDTEKFPHLNASVSDPTNKPWQLIERLSFALYNLSFEQQNNLWAMLGAKYIPSVVYRMKMLTFFDLNAKEKAVPIVELSCSGNGA